AVFAQRPEAMYVHRALQQKNKNEIPKSDKQFVIPPMKNLLLNNCPDCDTISFYEYTPDSTYISIYGSDSVWVNTYIGSVPNSASFLNFEEGCLNFMHY